MSKWTRHDVFLWALHEFGDMLAPANTMILWKQEVTGEDVLESGGVTVPELMEWGMKKKPASKIVKAVEELKKTGRFSRDPR